MVAILVEFRHKKLLGSVWERPYIYDHTHHVIFFFLLWYLTYITKLINVCYVTDVSLVTYVMYHSLKKNNPS